MTMRGFKGYIYDGLTFVFRKEDIRNARDELFVEATAFLPESPEEENDG